MFQLVLKFTMYADDTCAYVADKDIKGNIDRVNDELKSVDRWIKLNGLTLS